MPAVPLSVIIPTYNRSGYVRDCLTALRDSGVPGLEVIVADDGSTDDTRDVVAATDPAAKYLWRPNTGTPTIPRNTAFAASSGRYVAFLDCDDRWLPGVPAKAVALLDRYPEVDVLFADARMGNPAQGFRSWIEVAGQEAFFRLPHREPEPGFRVLDRGPFFRRMAERNAVFIGACVMRREAFAASGMFDPALCGAADWELWTRMSARFTFGFLNEPLAVYVRHDDNMSDNHDRMVGEFCQALRNVLVKCELSAADRTHVRGRLRHMLFHHGYLAYDAGQYADARSRFWQAIRAGALDPKTAAYWAASAMPRGVVSLARRAKRAAFPGWTGAPTPPK